MSTLNELLALMDQPHRTQSATWQRLERCPHADVLSELLESHRQAEPWRSLLVTYVLQREPKYWRTCLGWLRAIRQTWGAAWRTQGCPQHLSEFRFPDVQGKTQQRIQRSIARAIEAALVAGTIDDSDSHLAVRLLLAGKFLRSQHWRNFDTLPQPVLNLLQARSRSVEVIPDRLMTVMQQLFSYQRESWGAHIACAMGVLIGDIHSREDPHSAKSLHCYLSGLADIYRSRPQKEHGAITSHRLRAYLDQDGQTPKATRQRYVSYYVITQQAQERFLSTLGGQSTQLQPWLLKHVNSRNFFAHSDVNADSPRAPGVKAVEKIADKLFQAAESRLELLRTISHAVDEAISAMQTQRLDVIDVGVPVNLQKRKGLISLRIHCAVALAYKIYGHDNQREALKGQYVMEYLYVADRVGGEPLPEIFFAPIVRGWYDKGERKRLVGLGFPKRDYQVSQTGILHPTQPVGRLCGAIYRRAEQANQPLPVLFEAHSLYSAAACAVLALKISELSGLRTHDLLLIPATPLIEDDGSIGFYTRSKGKKDKRYPPTKHIISEEISSYWEEVMDIRDKKWPNATKVSPEFGDYYGIGQNYYLFQTDKALKSISINASIRFLLQDLAPTINGVSVTLVCHLFRHLYARRLKRQGYKRSKIKFYMGHATVAITDKYLGSASDGKDT